MSSTLGLLQDHTMIAEVVSCDTGVCFLAVPTMVPKRNVYRTFRWMQSDRSYQRTVFSWSEWTSASLPPKKQRPI